MPQTERPECIVCHAPSAPARDNNQRGGWLKTCGTTECIAYAKVHAWKLDTHVDVTQMEKNYAAAKRRDQLVRLREEWSHGKR